MTFSSLNESDSPATEPTSSQVTAVKLDEVEIRVDKVHVEGIRRTKEDVIVNIIKQLFDSKNFGDVVVKSNDVRRQLEQLGAFKQIGISIDTSHDGTKDGLEITYYVNENRRIIGGVNTMIGNNNDGSVVLQTRFPNLLGRGELFQCEYQHGTKRTIGFHSLFQKPLYPWIWPNPKISASVYQQGCDHPWSSFRQVDKGMLLDLTFKSSSNVRHTMTWEGVWRDLSSLTGFTPFAVREESGHTLKSSLRHVLSLDTRDDPVLPSDGVLFKLQQEYAGLGGNVAFHKHELDLQYNVPLLMLNDVILQCSLRTGIMRPSQKINSVTCINDRFFIGGPLNLRGFQLNGVGPHSEGAALGANTYWIGGLHLYTPLPFRPGQGGLGDLFRTHFFFTTGNIGNLTFSDDYYKNMNLLLNRSRYSIGLGIVFSVGNIARFELNYCLPWGQQPGDKVDKGLQFGVGISFV